MFADVIPWALARYTDDGSIGEIDDDDLETALLAVGRAALSRATHPENLRLKRIAFNEAAQFPEINVSAVFIPTDEEVAGARAIAED